LGNVEGSVEALEEDVSKAEHLDSLTTRGVTVGRMAGSRPGVGRGLRRRRRVRALVLGAVRSAGGARAMDSLHLSQAAAITRGHVDTGESHGAVAVLPVAGV